MAINFPDSPSNDDVFTSGEKSWIYRSAIGAWDAYSTAEEAQPDVVLIDTQTASSSPSIVFTDLSPDYTRYEVKYTSVVPGTDAARLGLRTSTDNGSSYDSGGSDYRSENHAVGGGNDSAAGFTGSYIRLSSGGFGSSSNEIAHGTVEICNPSASEYTRTMHRVSYVTFIGGLVSGSGTGHRSDASAVDAIQFIFDTGDISSGNFKLYGYK